MDANGVVHAVSGRNINGGKVIYEVASTVETPQGPQQVKLATFDGQLAGVAKTLENQRASFNYEVQQKGQYTNWYLNGIAPEGQLATASGNGDSAVNGIPITNGNNGNRGGRGGGGFKRSPEETASIVKQNVLGTAHAFIGQLYQGLGPEFIEAAKDEAKKYAAELFDIAKPKPAAGTAVEVPVAAVAPVVTTPIIPTASTPAEVAAQVPGVAVGVAAPAVPPADASTIAWN